MGLSLNAQTNLIFFEDFSNGMPADFSVYDLDMRNPEITWFQGQPGWIVNPAFMEAAISTSWYTPAGASDDWMITPGIEIPFSTNPENKILLVWWASSSAAQWPDSYRVLVSNAGNTPGDFTASDVVFSIAAPPGETANGILRFVDLSAWEGETIYVAFHNNTFDGELLIVDDIMVGEFAPFDVTGVRSTTRGYNPTGNINLRTEIFNTGHQFINSVVAHYKVNDGDVITDTITGQNIAPFRRHVIVHPTPAYLELGISTIESWVSEINFEEDPTPDNNIVIEQFSAYDPNETVTRKVLVETFTSSTCAPCLPGNNQLHSVINNLSADNKPINLKIQQNFPGTGDPYATNETVFRRDYYNISAIPDTRVDGDFWAGNTNNITANQIVGAKNRAGLFDYDLEYMVDTIEQTVHITGTVTPLTDILPGTRLMMVIREAITKNNVKTNGETQFLDVVKKYINGLDGIELTGALTGEPLDIDISYTFNGNYRLPANGAEANRINHAIEHSVENFNNLSVVAWVEYGRDRFVLNAGTAELMTSSTETPQMLDIFNVFPNPASHEVQVDIALDEMLDCQIVLFDVTGKPAKQIFAGTLSEGHTRLPVSLDGLPSGTYFLHLRSAQGITVRTLDVIR